jgi:hypothetical protein
MTRRVEMRSEIRRAENVVTVLTYERTDCPILNQVPRPMRCRSLHHATSLNFEAARCFRRKQSRVDTRISSGFNLWMHAKISAE